ncbi:hypothetical protein NliqN6_3132 [Naganishia liquefaciens]|uniref:DM2 domain-containing protein n=1 Tax=Naganishia liquefaciens TaxID=104408 RepID=A0A8H3TU56_9TREE|nr:hypothetical protein NliqN6_3132 [Naganishia liquefaciens]
MSVLSTGIPAQHPAIQQVQQQQQQQQQQMSQGTPQALAGKRKLDSEQPEIKKQRPPMPPPHVLASLVPESAMFEELLKMEQKLDWTILRKKAEVTDAIGKPVRIKRTMRVYISNTAYNQAWQKDEEVAAGKEPMSVNVETGDGIPSWNLKIEGRLLDTGNLRIDKTAKRKFSQCLKHMVVEFANRDMSTYPEGNIVEWHPRTTPPAAPLDGFEIKRRGDQPIDCRIIMHLDQYPDKFKVLPPLCDMIGIAEESRSVVLSAVWKFIKTVGAQDKDDVTKLLPVGGLQKIMDPKDKELPFHMLPEVVNRYLTAPSPVILNYKIQVDQDRSVCPKVFDIPIEIEDPLKTKSHAILSSLEGQPMKEIMSAEDDVATLAYTIRTSREKRDFLLAFSKDPANFINRWLASQARDLDAILGRQIGVAGENGGNIREEDLRRTDLFKMPWVEEAVTIHEGRRQAEYAERVRQIQAEQQANAARAGQGRPPR